MGMLDSAMAQWVLDTARRYGATAADVLCVSSESIGAGVRMGEIEKLKSSRERRVGIRVFVDHASANASTADLDRKALEAFVAETVAMARLTSPDPESGLPDPQLQASTGVNLDLEDTAAGIVSADEALAVARKAEKAALAFDSRISNSEGAEFESGRHEVLLANSQGFCASYSGTTYSLGVAPIAAENGAMQQGYWYTANRHRNKLDDPETVGVIAAQRAIRRLGARKIKTMRCPVVFEPDMAAGLIRTLAGAASGPALYKGASFLVGRLGTRVAAANVTIVDDGAMIGGLASRPFDGEGLATRRNILVEQGVLKTYLLDTYSARKLNLAPTGSASRGVGSPPSVAATNLYLEPGQYSPSDIVGSIKQGLLVTELMGFGVNTVTGDYSRGASGIWIENGELAYPVQEITIAGNLKDMYLAIDMIANDLVWRSSTAAPTIRISQMTVAGS
jgi:PmbA protein